MLTESSGWQVAMICNGGGCVEIGVWQTAIESQGTSNCVEIGAWGKASRSFANHNCVEIGAWSTSEMSSHNGGCVEVAAWNTAEASESANCVETGAWSKAEASSYNGSCVEVMAEDDLGEMGVHVRDTKDRTIPPVVFGLNAWTEFIRRCNAGEFPLRDGSEHYHIGHLVYTRGEWEAFLDGAGKGEFDLSPELAVMAAG